MIATRPPRGNNQRTIARTPRVDLELAVTALGVYLTIHICGDS